MLSLLEERDIDDNSQIIIMSLLLRVITQFDHMYRLIALHKRFHCIFHPGSVQLHDGSDVQERYCGSVRHQGHQRGSRERRFRFRSFVFRNCNL